MSGRIYPNENSAEKRELACGHFETLELKVSYCLRQDERYSEERKERGEKQLRSSQLKPKEEENESWKLLHV